MKIKIEKNIPKENLEEIKKWPIWEKEVSEFPWFYGETEVCYILEGHVVVTSEGGEAVEIFPGDYVLFPAGMACTWKITKSIRKHYNFI
jgi:uncharacterized cupin superfamily protein